MTATLPGGYSMVDHFYTGEQVAERLQVSIDTVLREAARGRLRSTRIGRQRRYSEADVMAYIEASQDGHPDTKPNVIPITKHKRKDTR